MHGDAPITCSDLHNTAHCCDSCHQDEDEGYASMWWDSWLHACCRALDALNDLGSKWLDEEAVRAFLAERNSHAR